MEIKRLELIPKEKYKYAINTIELAVKDFKNLYDTTNPVEVTIDWHEWYRFEIRDLITNIKQIYVIPKD